jgi:hypothetical protein
MRLSFDRSLALEFHGAKISSDAGPLAYREMDEVLGLTSMCGRLLNDWRNGKNTQHSMQALTRQSIYSQLAGYEDTNDAERLAVDPIMRHVVGGRPTEHAAASTSQMARFETEVLTKLRNLAALTNLSGEWIDRLRDRRRPREVVLDMDSSVSETYGEQEGTVYNGYFGCTCYHPLFCFNQFGDVERSMLREGNVRRSNLTTTREKLIKIGAKAVCHARRLTFQLAEMAAPRRLFLAILGSIGRLRLPTPAPG